MVHRVKKPFRNSNTYVFLFVLKFCTISALMLSGSSFQRHGLCVCVRVCVCVCMYVCIYVCVYTGIYVCMCAYTYVSVYVSMYVYLYVCMRLSICMSVFICTFVCMYDCICYFSSSSCECKWNQSYNHLFGSVFQCVLLGSCI